MEGKTARGSYMAMPRLRARLRASVALVLGVTCYLRTLRRECAGILDYLEKAL